MMASTDVERDGRVHQLPGQVEAVDGAFQLAAVLRQPVGQELEHLAGQLEGGIGQALLLHPPLQDLETQLLVEIGDLDDETALHARAHAIVEAVELPRRTGRSDHDLAAAIQQRVDDVLELLLGLLALHELEIVDQQNVDGAELVLEGDGVLAAHGLHELIAEALGRQVEHLRLGRAPLHLPGDGMQQMRLAEPDMGMEVERVERPLLVEHGRSHLGRHRVGDAVGLALHEALEGVLGIERRALEAVDGGAA